MMSAGDGVKDVGNAQGVPAVTDQSVFDEMREKFSASVPDDGQYWNQFETDVYVDGKVPHGVFQLVRTGKPGSFLHSPTYSVRFFSGSNTPLIEARFNKDGTLHVEKGSLARRIDIMEAAIKSVTGKDVKITVDDDPVACPTN